MFRPVIMPLLVTVFGVYALGNLGVLEMPAKHKVLPSFPFNLPQKPASAKPSQVAEGRLSDRVSKAQPQHVLADKLPEGVVESAETAPVAPIYLASADSGSAAEKSYVLKAMRGGAAESQPAAAVASSSAKQKESRPAYQPKPKYIGIVGGR